MKKFLIAIAFSVFLSPAYSASLIAGDFQPKQPVELVIMAGQGGGADRLARLVQSIIAKNKMSKMPFIPVNKGGGSGAEALRYLKDKNGANHTVMATLNSYYTTPLRTDIGVDIAEFTPIARLAVDTFVLWVHADSPVKTLDDWVKAVKAKGGKWKMGGTGTGQEDSLVTAMLEKKFGLKITYIPYKGGGGVAKALIGNHIDSTVNNPSEQLGFYLAKKSRPIAVFTPERLKVFPDTPTMKELGHDMVYYMQRSIVAPKGISPEAKKYYTDLFQKVNESKEWVDYTSKKALFRDFLSGADLQKFFLEERESHRKLLKEMGEIK